MNSRNTASPRPTRWWQMAALCSALLLCGASAFGQCTTVLFTSPYPGATYTPVCNGLANAVGGVTDHYTGEYSNVALTNGTTYQFSSSTATDYVTITDGAGVVKAAGITPVTYRAVATATHRFFLHNAGPAACGGTATNRTRRVLCGTAPTCTAFPNGLYPAATFTPTCSGVAQNVGGVTNCWAGEYSNVALTTGVVYTFGSNNAADYLTILDAGGTIVLASGRQPLVYVAQATATHRFGTHVAAPAACGAAAVSRTRTITCPGGGGYNPCTTIPTISACGVSTVSAHTGTGAPWNIATCGFTTPGQEKVYSFTPTITGTHVLQVTAATGGYIDYFWKVASGGCSNTGWTCIDDNNAAGTDNFGPLTAGTQYYILLDPEGTGAFSHTFQINCPVAPPANDACANAITVPGMPYTSGVVANGAATDDVPTTTCTGPFKNVWWKVTPTLCGPITVQTCPGSNFDTEVAVFTGACGSMTQVGCNDDGGAPCTGLLSAVTWTGVAGTTYHISVGSYFNGGPTGNIQILVSTTAVDTDGDLLGNTCDPDDDNDGIADGSDNAALNTNSCQDVDADGCDDCAGAHDGFGLLANNDVNDDGTDTDGDGICNTGDADDDNDGIADGSDNAPLNPDSCEDSDGDGCDDCSQNGGSFAAGANNFPGNDGADFDNDGLCDSGDPDDDNDAVPDATDPNDANNFVCGDSDGDTCDDCAVAGTFSPANDGTDTDGDGICDNGDNCDNDVNAAQTNSDTDALGDACDPCNNVDNATPGSACDDGNPNTVLDTYVQSGTVPNATCACVGVTCTTDLDFVYQADGADDLDWFIYTQITDVLVQTGGGALIGNGSEATCLPDGCYYLVVTDGGGDGIVNGGYMLKINSAARLIDNLYGTFGEGGFTSGTTSAIAGDEGFCLPVSTDRLIFTSCDKRDWKIAPCGGEYMVANDNGAVSAEYAGANAATSGYQMWWYAPNSGYSFKRFQSHNTANGLPASATRACHFKLNAWAGNQLVEGSFYNVKVRGRIAGNYNNWGPVCRMVVNSTEAQCPRTKLMDIPSNQYLSCGQMRAVGTNEYVHARPAKRMTISCAWQNANRYQFRFRIPAEFVTIVKTSATGQYWVNTNGLTCGKTYDVDVRASFDGGSTWCHAGDPYGDVCLLTTTCAFGMAEESSNGTPDEARMAMYPNPNRGDQLRLSLSSVEEGVETVSVDIHDAQGVRVANRTIAVQDGFVNTDLDLNGALSNGLYMVNVTAGAASYNERLVIQR